MKREQKSLTNKGFSLVELIIVVAIMAVLIGVLAPQYLRYVEKSRLQKDNTSIAEVANVIKMASAEEDVVTVLKSGDVTYGFGAAGMTGVNTTALDNEITATITPADVKVTSNTYATTAPTLIVHLDPATSIISVTATGWVEKPGDTPTTSTNAKKF